MNRSTQHEFEPEEIMAYLDGELEARQAAMLGSHLEHCTECQAVAAQLKQVSERLLDFQVEPCPSTLDPSGLLWPGQSISVKTRQESGRSLRKMVTFRLRKLVPQTPVGWAAIFGAMALLGVAMTIVLGRYGLAGNGARTQVNYLVLPEVSVDNARVPAPPLRPAQSHARPPDSNGNFQADKGGIIGGVPHGTTGKAGGGEGTGSPYKKWLGDDTNYIENQEKEGIEAPKIRGPMIVEIASITILAQSYDEASSRLQPLTAAHSGYVQDMTAESRTGTARSVSATLRVPATQLEPFLSDLRKLGHVEQETRNNQEVTDAYIDLNARLKTARATEQRILQLLGTRTGKLSDVLEAEQELERVRGEIESMDGERTHMEHQVDYATVQVQLNEEYREQLNPESFSTGRRLRNSLVEGVGNLAGGITALAMFLSAYGPSIVFWAALMGVPAWFIWRRVKRKASEKA